MKRKTLFMMLVSFSTMAVLTVSVLVGVGKTKKFASRTSANDTYTQTLNSSIFSMSSLTTDYQTNVQQSFGASLPLVMNYSLAKKDGSGNLVLAPAGKVFNYSKSATYNGRITNIKSVTVTYTGGTLYLQEGLAGDATTYGEKSVIASGVGKELLSSPNYVMLTNSVAATTITSLTVEYSCSLAGWEVERLGELYNGKGSDGNTYELTRSGSNVSVAGQNGTVSIDNSGNFTISLASGTIVYTGSVSSDYKTLTFTGKSGANAALAPTFKEINRVYVLDDFESYTQNGTTFTGNASHGNAQSLAYVNSATASDLRGAWYTDYAGNGNNTWLEGSNFSIPTSTDFLNTVTNVKHSGNRSATFKASTGGWMRYWTREIFNQDQHFNYGQGNVLSFWAHGGYTNTACTNNATAKAKVSVQAYYQNFVINDSNRKSTTYGTGVTVKEIPGGSGWTEYKITLDPTRKVYAINFMMDNSGLSGANQYIPIDDIRIYTEPVYEPTKKYDESSTNFTKTYNGTVNMSLLGNSYTFTVKVGLGANGFIKAYAGADMEAQSYSISGNQITIVTTGSYSGKTFGTWVGTLSNNNQTITIQKANISGDIKDYMTSSSIVLTENTVLVNGSEGNLSTLENRILRQYYDGSKWATDTGNSDRLSINTNYYIEGSASVRVRPYGSNNMRIIMNPSYADSLNKIDSIAFWFYVPAGVNYNLSIYTYKDAEPVKETGRYKQQYDHTYDGSKEEEAGWQYIDMGLDKANDYGVNFAIFIGTNSAQTILDYVTYF